MDLLRNAILLLAAGTVSAETCTYDGAWDNVPANAEDEVVVVSGALTWTASMPATVKSWTQSGGAEYGDGYCRIDYPVLKRCDPMEGRRAAWVLKNDCNLNLTRNAKVRDVHVIGTKARIYLNGYKLKIMSDRHEISPNASQIVLGGTAEAPGEIVWKRELVVIVR